MEIEAYIVKRVNLLMNATDAKIVKRLEGGMSNYTYVVECQGVKYTYRVPGKYAERFVDRNEEWENIQKVEKLGVNNKTLQLSKSPDSLPPRTSNLYSSSLVSWRSEFEDSVSTFNVPPCMACACRYDSIQFLAAPCPPFLQERDKLKSSEVEV